MNIGKYFKTKISKLVVVSLIVNLLILYFISGIFDIGSSILYILLGIIFINTFRFKKIKIEHYFISGGIIAIIYNLLFSLMNFFDVTLIFMATSALQQGIVTFLVAKVGGIK